MHVSRQGDLKLSRAYPLLVYCLSTSNSELGNPVHHRPASITIIHIQCIQKLFLILHVPPLFNRLCYAHPNLRPQLLKPLNNPLPVPRPPSPDSS